jgi:DNA-binding transcriptional MerR regulator
MKTFEAKKLYYAISEVSEMTAIEPHTLRYWEQIFPSLSPSKNAKGNRVYTNKDIAVILSIKSLVYDKGYTLEGAKKVLSEDAPPTNAKAAETLVQSIVKTGRSASLEHQKKLLADTKVFLENLLDILDDEQ